jgi:hypothetical protein
MNCLKLFLIFLFLVGCSPEEEETPVSPGEEDPNTSEEEEVTPALYFFYANHTHLEGDYLPYTDSDLERIRPLVAQNIVDTIDAIADLFDSYSAKITFEVVYGTSKGICEYQGIQDNVLLDMSLRGHEIGVHTHRTVDIEKAMQNLTEYCQIPVLTASGFMAEVRDSDTPQATLAEALQSYAQWGIQAATENLVDLDSSTFLFGELCNYEIGVGNDMWGTTGNLMFPWKPDYENGDNCIHNSEGDIVMTDHVSIAWMNLQGHPDVLTTEHFDNLKTYFDEALNYMERERPSKIAVWGFVSHLTEFMLGDQGESGPFTPSLDALNEFLEYVDSYADQGRVRYATVSEIRDLYLEQE